MRVVTTCATKDIVSLMVPRDRTYDGGSVFQGDPDSTNNSDHDGSCDDDGYYCSRGHEVACDERMHHNITAISDTFSRGHEVACDNGMHHIITAISDSLLSIGTGRQCL